MIIRRVCGRYTFEVRFEEVEVGQTCIVRRFDKSLLTIVKKEPRFRAGLPYTCLFCGVGPGEFLNAVSDGYDEYGGCLVHCCPQTKVQVPITDQYGDDVPSDLCTLVFCETCFSESDIEAAMQVPWYEVSDDRILVPLSELAGLECTNGCIACAASRPPFVDLADMMSILSIGRIAESLKRFSPEDGFYHA